MRSAACASVPIAGDHDRQAIDELSKYLPADTTVTDDDSSSQPSSWCSFQEDCFDLPAAAEVFGEVVVVIAESAEIDDLAYGGACSSLPE